MLGDAAGFAGDDAGLADGVEQRGLAVVDVTHDGDDRRTRDELACVVGNVEDAFFDVGFGDALDGVAEFAGDEFGEVGVDDVARLHHLAFLHQVLDDVDGAFRHALRQFLNGDGFRQDDFAHDLFAGFLHLAAAEFSWRRRMAAIERPRALPSSSTPAVPIVSLPRRRSSSVFGRVVTGFAGSGRTTRPRAGAPRGAGRSSSSFSRRRRTPVLQEQRREPDGRRRAIGRRTAGAPCGWAAAALRQRRQALPAQERQQLRRREPLLRRANGLLPLQRPGGRFPRLRGAFLLRRGAASSASRT
jgi:hypothetical protein